MARGTGTPLTTDVLGSHSMFNLPMVTGEQEGGQMARTHGLPSTYNNGKCRCPACQAAIAEYRASRRERGLDLPPKRELAAASSSTKKGKR